MGYPILTQTQFMTPSWTGFNTTALPKRSNHHTQVKIRNSKPQDRHLSTIQGPQSTRIKHCFSGGGIPKSWVQIKQIKNTNNSNQKIKKIKNLGCSNLLQLPYVFLAATAFRCPCRRPSALMWWLGSDNSLKDEAQKMKDITLAMALADRRAVDRRSGALIDTD